MKRSWKILFICIVVAVAGNLLSHEIFGFYPEAIAKSKLDHALARIQKVELSQGQKASISIPPSAFHLIKTSLLGQNYGWDVINTTRIAPIEFLTIYSEQEPGLISYGYSDKNILFY